MIKTRENGRVVVKRTSINPDIQTLTYRPYISGLAKMWLNRNALKTKRVVVGVLDDGDIETVTVERYNLTLLHGISGRFGKHMFLEMQEYVRGSFGYISMLQQFNSHKFSIDDQNSKSN